MFKYRATDNGQPVGTVHVNNIVHDVEEAKKLLADKGHVGDGVKLAYCGRDKTQGSVHLMS